MTHINISDISSPYWIILVNTIVSLLVLFGIGVFRFVYPKKPLNLFIILIIISIIPTFSLYRPGTYRAGDVRTHTAQLADFYYNLQQGNVIPQWAGDLCGEYGCPVYQIEYVFPYYIGSFFHLFGFSFLTSVKLELATAFIASGITMYLWATEEFGTVPGFTAALFYLFAPYHLIDLEFRGSVGEVTSFVFIPLLFLFMKRLMERREKKYFFLEGITVWFLLITHSSTAAFSLPLTVFYCFILWFRNKKRRIKELLIPFAALFYGVLLAAYYVLPAALESKYTWWSSPFISASAFQPIWEFLISPIAYGFLFQGHQGEYRLIIGYPQLLLILFGLYLLVRNKINQKLKPLLIILLLYFVFLFFMMLSPSDFIWKNVPFLNTFLMVWRLLVPMAFVTAAIAGIIVKHIPKTSIIVIICLVTVLSTILNWENRYMVPPMSNPFMTADDVYTEYMEPGNPLFIKQYKHDDPLYPSIIDNPPKTPIEFLSGKGKVSQLSRLQISHEYIVDAYTPVTIRENTFYFPGWTVFANNKSIPINYKNQKNNSVGIVTFSLPKGLYLIKLIYMDSPVRRIAKLISFYSLILGMGYIAYKLAQRIKYKPIKIRKSK